MKVVLLGRLAEAAGWRERDMTAATASELRAALAQADPALGEALAHPGVRVVVDQCLAGAADDLRGAKEVAFLPVVSGG